MIKERITLLDKQEKSFAGKLKNSITLMFEPDLEQEYMDYFFEKMRDQITYAIYVGLILFLLFGVLDFIILHGNVKWFWIIRFAIILPLTTMLAQLSKRDIFRNYFQQLQAVLVIIGGLSIIAMLLIGTSLVQEIYYAGLILVICYCFVILHLRFIIASILALFIFMVYQIAILYINCLDPIRLINNSFFLFTSILLGAFSSYYYETIIRRDFLLKRNLEAEKRVISNVNETLGEKLRIENNKLKHSLEEKNILLMEIHHRVRNNMQIISSILNLQMNFVKDESSKEQFKICRSRVKSLSLIHEKLYNSKDFINIDFGDYVNSLVRILYASYRNETCKVVFKYNINNIFLDINIAIPCAFIINELVSNSLKHAFPDQNKGEIEISLTKIDGIYELLIRDDGIGIDENVNISNSSTLGLVLVNSLTAQLHGKLELDKKHGTSIKICFGDVKLKSYNRLESVKL